MKRKLLALMLFAAGSVFAQISIGVMIGPPPPPRVVWVQPACPGPEYIWVQGYWYPAGNHYRWHDAYWSRPPYAGAYWVARYKAEAGNSRRGSRAKSPTFSASSVSESPNPGMPTGTQKPLIPTS